MLIWEIREDAQETAGTGPCVATLDLSADGQFSEPANDAAFSETSATLDKKFRTAQARLAIHGRQLNREPHAPACAQWFHLIGKAGRTCIFVNLEEVQAYVDKLDGKSRLAGAGQGGAA